MDPHLATTNLILGIMAAVSVLELLMLIGAAVAGYEAYRRVMDLVNGLEERQVAPVMARVNAILDDLKDVSATITEETGRIDQAIRTTMDRVDQAAGRVRSNVRTKTNRVIRLIKGARMAIEAMIVGEPRSHGPVH